ncbi:MAG: hypothetical protein LBE76_09060 [Nitrososphaerota archaeon]|nr:hypothetical protein [Nitrososphaerota archaeon]
MHIYHDKVLIYNDGKLPESWIIEDLFAPHTSKPYNLWLLMFFPFGAD